MSDASLPSGFGTRLLTAAEVSEILRIPRSSVYSAFALLEAEGPAAVARASGRVAGLTV